MPNGDAALRWFYGVARKTLANEGANERFMSAVIVGEAGLIAVGTDVWASPDGLSWSWIPQGVEVFGAAGVGEAEIWGLRSVTDWGQGFVAVGSPI